MKRFYKSAAAVQTESGYMVNLDGRPVRTPARAPLVLPGLALGEAVAAEWNAQGDKIIPDTMPLMSFASTAIDRVSGAMEAVAAEASGFAASDLLCYRADQPIELAQRQADAWDPLLDWARTRYDVTFSVTTGIMPVEQPAENKARFTAVALAFDPHTLTGLHVMTTAYGSFLLALAVVEGRLTAPEALAISRVDETFQAELWGTDEEAEKRHQRLLREVTSAQHFIELLRLEQTPNKLNHL
ncbi:MAG: ATPase [Rhodospirillaceae bacterium]|jgi:chaperone required for assembly of F1-ATPase|uniref:ATP12 family chaperone protein n=1 Tax=Hwanghaeella sp. 1Z406 TaxID=3402811 RepID=UPI000C5BA651|nr:ATPase [Rhodospirillales bacterium]MAX47287.1 ATPase [Rhodospirillaceae bacterium]|tara:strand:- start:39565 stop:40290 length:726 start_codon:yes stop_codon:yes gene_type:complete